MTLARPHLLAALLALAVAAPHVARGDEAALLAKEHFRQGSKLFDLQRYSEAAAEYERAYDIKEIPDLLYNIGQAYRLGNEPKKALAAYRAYLRRSPNASYRDEVLAFIEALKQTIEAQKTAQEKPPTGPIEPAAPAVTSNNPPPPVVVAPPPPPPRKPDQHELLLGKKLRVAGLATGGVGVVALALGGVFAGLTVKTSDQLNHPATTTPPPVYNKSLEQRGRVYQALGPTMFAVGGAALVGGVTAFVVGTRKVKRNTFALAPSVGPGIVALSLSGGF